VNQKAVLERADRAVDVPKVVDRRPLGLDTGLQRVLDRVSQPGQLGSGQPPGGP
jgi:hypothetical protein